jgi:tRNA A37 threonylcarbamoyladenosine modification protein TsaB
VDGRRGEIFVQTFQLGSDVRTGSEPRVAKPEDVADQWERLGEPVTFTGDGVDRYPSLTDSVGKGSSFAQPVPSVHAALSLGAVGPPSDVVTPLYLREADAVANFATRQRPT